MNTRNIIEKGGFILEQLATVEELEHFNCGDSDLNEYFQKDRIRYREELLTQSYKFYSANEEPRHILAVVDFCNDSLARCVIGKPDLRRIHHNKRGYKVYPAVKITRLGVDEAAHGTGVGSILLQIIKEFFTTNNRSGCRFITVDAYRAAVPFYQKNGFIFAKAEEDEEDRRSSTLPLFFDLKRFVLAE